MSNRKRKKWLRPRVWPLWITLRQETSKITAYVQRPGLSKRLAWAWLSIVITVALGALLTVAAIAAIENPWSALCFLVAYSLLMLTWAAIMRVIRSD